MNLFAEYLKRKVAVRLAGYFALIAMLAYTVARADLPFQHDSLYYWELGSRFVASGSFSIRNYNDGLRGYLFPFLLYLIQAQSAFLSVDAKILFSMYSAIFFAAFTVFLVPWFFTELLQYHPGSISRLLFAGLLFYFWRGHFLYPLTDLPALAAGIAAATLWMRAIRSEMRAYGFILVGVLAGASMNLRPIYLISGIILLGGSVLAGRTIGWRRILYIAALQIFGYGLILLPQVMINRVHFQSSSPFVQAKYLDENNLYALQLFWGLKTQKVETNIGDNYPSSLVVYEDPLSEKIKGLGVKEKNISNYLSVIRNYPFDVAISYFRHAFNGMDTKYATPYVRNIFSDNRLFSLTNYLIWFLFALHVFHLDPTRLEMNRLLVLSSLILPVALAIPTVIEVRFFLPLYVIAYGAICFGIDLREFQARHLGNLWSSIRLFALCLLWIAVSFTLSADTMATLAMW